MLILTTLTSARDLETYKSITQDINNVKRVSSCLDLSRNTWGKSLSRGFFNHPNEPNFNFTIATTYDVFYPNTLSNLLVAYGFIPENAIDVPESERCGWWGAGEVKVNGRVHGNVLWKYSDFQRSTAAPTLENLTSWEAISQDQASLRLTIRPRDQTLNIINTILVKNAPDADVYWSWTTALGFICGMLSTLLLFQMLKFYVNPTVVDERVDHETLPGIELDKIRVHSLSGSGMQRLHRDDYAKRPAFTIEPAESAARNSYASSFGGGIADPPPIYSVDGAGR
jgi:hypothetical protein